MLVNEPPAPTKPTTTYSGDTIVHLANGVRCPYCGRELRATDVDVNAEPASFEIVLRCYRCHRTILEIE